MTECLVSMSIISLMIYIMSVSFNYSIKFITDNKDKIEIIDILEEYINDKKEYIKFSIDDIDFYEEINIRGHNIKSSIIKDKEKENIYKLDTLIEYNNKQIEVSTYVWK